MDGKYGPLFDYLSGNQNQSIRLTFSKIEKILGDDLPDSARRIPQWWGNDRTHHHAQSWLRAGYKTSGQPDFASEEVSFVRVAMQEEAQSPDTYPIDEKYPVDVEVLYPERSSRLQALLVLTIVPKFVLLIPHYFVLYVLGLVALMAAIVGLLMVLLTGKYPRVLFNFQVGVVRYNTRVSAWFICLVDKYPPFRLKS